MLISDTSICLVLFALIPALASCVSARSPLTTGRPAIVRRANGHSDGSGATGPEVRPEKKYRWFDIDLDPGLPFEPRYAAYHKEMKFPTHFGDKSAFRSFYPGGPEISQVRRNAQLKG